MARLKSIADRSAIVWEIDQYPFFIGSRGKSSASGAVIGRDEKGAFISDNGSGELFVNHRKIERKELVSGDVIAVGGGSYLFEEDEADVSGETPASDPAAPDKAESKDEMELKVLFTMDMARPLPGLDARSVIAKARGSNSYAILQFARLVAAVDSVSELLAQTLNLIFEVVHAERGVIFLYGETGRLEPSVVKRIKGGKPPDVDTARAVTGKAIKDRSTLVCSDACLEGPEEEPSGPETARVRSALVVPIWDEEEVLGAIYLDNTIVGGLFHEDDMDLINVMANLVALRIRQEKARDRARKEELLRSALERFHSPDVAGLILRQSDSGRGFKDFVKEREVTVLFSDVSSFTGLLERLDASEAAGLLTEYFDVMTDVVFKYKGTVDKFIGDAVMATFGAPISHGNDAELAVFAAIEMMRNMEWFKASRPERQKFDIRIGINTGVVIAGYLGSGKRIEYTVLGDPVNVASRLQTLAEPGQILVGESTYAKVSGMFEFEDRGETLLKGKKKKTRVYEVRYSLAGGPSLA